MEFVLRRTYTELLKFSTLEERFSYLMLGGAVGRATFGSRRWMNQSFYASREWRDVRRFIVVRDDGCDLGLSDFPISRRPEVHHMNPITEADLENRSRALFDPENLITVSHNTHNGIHYGDERQLPRPLIERMPGDTKEWGDLPSVDTFPGSQEREDSFYSF